MTDERPTRIPPMDLSQARKAADECLGVYPPTNRMLLTRALCVLAIAVAEHDPENERYDEKDSARCSLIVAWLANLYKLDGSIDAMETAINQYHIKPAKAPEPKTRKEALMDQYGGPDPDDEPEWWADTSNFDGDLTELF